MTVSDTLSCAEVMAADAAARCAQPDSFVNRVLAQPYDVVAGKLQ